MTATSADSYLGTPPSPSRPPHHQEHLLYPPCIHSPLAAVLTMRQDAILLLSDQPHTQEQKQCRFAEGITAADRL